VLSFGVAFIVITSLLWSLLTTGPGPTGFFATVAFVGAAAFGVVLFASDTIARKRNKELWSQFGVRSVLISQFRLWTGRRGARSREFKDSLQYFFLNHDYAASFASVNGHIVQHVWE
jgi:hypothetical protein